jgi:hypothetical protein
MEHPGRQRQFQLSGCVFSKSKSDDESADQKTVALFFIERRDLKNPATGNPCVLTAG